MHTRLRKTIAAPIVATLAAFCLAAAPAAACADNVPVTVEKSQDGLTLIMTADKASYDVGDTALIGFTVGNEAVRDASNVNVALKLPENMKAEDPGSLSVHLDTMAVGERRTCEVRASVEASGHSSGGPGSPSVGSESPGGGPVGAVREIPGGLLAAGDMLAPLAALAVLLALAALGAGAFALVKNEKRRGQAPLSVLLAVALVAGTVPSLEPAGKAHADEAARSSFSAQASVAVLGAVQVVEAVVSYDAPLPLDPAAPVYKVGYLLGISDALVSNNEAFKPRKIAEGELLARPEDPTSPVADFAGWYADMGLTQPFDFDAPIVKNTFLVAKWILDETDSDNDGLPDGQEVLLGSDPHSPDTDGDGLTDGWEVKLGTSPLKPDTDGDGVLDIDEDADMDGLSNGWEIELGTDPLNPDTDGDGLSDGREIELGTDPLKADTDGDGADDGMEVIDGTDPLAFNESFPSAASSEQVTKDNPVAASVKAELSASQVGTLEVRRASAVDEPLADASIPGYMGAAYSFSVDGKPRDAAITFSYDQGAFGLPNDSFSPSIYYVNHETGTLDKLEGQTREDNTVSAPVSHFSTYVLLNDVPFEKAWAADILPPLQGSGAIDVVFVIDRSMSMDYNDPDDLRKLASKQFIDKLKEGADRAGVVAFTRNAHVESKLSSDKAVLKAAIDGIVNDDGWGPDAGTDGSAGISVALSMLAASDAPNKLVLFLTDGLDSWTPSIPYDKLEADAQAQRTALYTVGLGPDPDKDLLLRIAQATGGRYYEAKAGLDLDEIYDEIEGETVDLTLDSNADGIPDYYNQRIKDGTMLLSNGSRRFAGIDFDYDEDGNPSDDYDHDGVKNGEELRIVTTPAGGVYLAADSDPLGAPHEPPSYDPSGDAQILLDDARYCYPAAVAEKRDGFLSALDTALGFVFGANRSSVTRGMLVDYVSDYSAGTKAAEAACERDAMIDALEQMRASVSDAFAEGTALAEDLNAVIGDVNSLLAKLRDRWTPAAIVEIEEEFSLVAAKVSIVCPDRTYSITMVSLSHTARVTVELAAESQGASKEIDRIAKGVTAATTALNAVSSIQKCAKAGANNAVLSANAEMLADMKENGAEFFVRGAAGTVLDQLAGDYTRAMSSILGETVVEAGLAFLENVVTKNPVGLAVVAARDAIGIVFGLGEHYEQGFQMVCIDEVTASARRLHSRAQGFERERALTDVAQTRILGERGCAGYESANGLIGAFLELIGQGYDDSWLKGREAMVRAAADRLGLDMAC